MINEHLTQHSRNFARRTALLGGAVLLSSLAVSLTAQAADIRLKNKTKLTGDVVQMDDEHVFIRIPREAIATIEGSPLPPALAEGVAAPAFTVKDILGQTYSVGTNTGKVSLLHFWVQWCPHCRSDAPQIQTLYERFRDHPNVQVLTVNLDEQRATLDQFITAHAVAYPVIHAEEQAAGPNGVDLPELYQITGFPLTLIIDAQGIIRHKISGSFVESHQDVGAILAKLLPTPQ